MSTRFMQWRMGFLALGVLLVPSVTVAQTVSPSGAFNHTVGVGLRGSFRFGDYAFGGVGGQVRLRVVSRVSVELFTEHHFGDAQGAHRHDHEIGGAVLFDAVRTRRWALQPLLGACAMLAMADLPSGDSLDDLRFGARAGLGSEWALGEHLSLQLQALVIAYFGRRFDPYQWPAGTTADLHVEPAGQITAGINWFL